jgi:hypothetical protein
MLLKNTRHEPHKKEEDLQGLAFPSLRETISFTINGAGEAPRLVEFTSDEPQSKSHEVTMALEKSGFSFGQWLAANADPSFVQEMLIPLKVEYPQFF